MKAVLCRRWGDSPNLSFEEIDSMPYSARDVRISVHACGVNFADNLMVAGRHQLKPPFPFSPGFEVSGVITKIGEDVEELEPGDRVMASLEHGGYAEEVVVPSTHVLPIPEGMNFTTAAAFPVAYGTAHLALEYRACLGSREILVVHGAAGNVGCAAVEVGKRLGATVIATAGSPEHLEVAAERGADHTIHYGRENIRDRVLEITDGRGADVVFDPVGGDAFDESLRCVAWEGRILTIGFAGGRIPEAPAWRILLRSCAVLGMDWSGYLIREPEKVRASIAEALGWYSEGVLDPRPSHIFLLERAADALKAQAARQITGKVVLATDQLGEGKR
jgi:NADPH2:quinone reductase